MTHPSVAPEDLPLLQQLVARAKRVQHCTLTERQYQRLLREFLRVNEPPSSPLFGWFYAHRERLLCLLKKEGVSVKPARVPRLHRYRLSESGWKRLTQIEMKIRRAKQNRAA